MKENSLAMASSIKTYGKGVLLPPAPSVVNRRRDPEPGPVLAIPLHIRNNDLA